MLFVDEGQLARIARVAAETDPERVEDGVLFGIAVFDIRNF